MKEVAFGRLNSLGTTPRCALRRMGATILLDGEFAGNCQHTDPGARLSFLNCAEIQVPGDEIQLVRR
jgi:hypothetical protein